MSLKKTLIRGSIWAMVGTFSSLFMRLVSSYVLTRLLYPDAFGLMALVNTAIAGLGMFSDLGISPAIVQNERAYEPTFQQTAWTLQIIRSVALWAGACLLAFPIGYIYGEPMISILLPVAALSTIVSGFSSLSLPLYKREMKVRQLAFLDFLVQATSLLATIAIAWIYRSVWALAVAGIFSSAVSLAVSHWVFDGPKLRIGWHREEARRIMHFGRWIFLATMLTFIVNWGDRFVSGFFLTIAGVGIYNLAVMIGKLPFMIAQQLVDRLLFPAYAQIGTHVDDAFRSKVARLRGGVLALIVPPLCLLAIFGDLLISRIYDSRYHDAGWIVQVLAAGSIAQVISATMSHIALARGNSFLHLLQLIVQSLCMIAAMLIGGFYWGQSGLICGAAFNPLLAYPIIFLMLRKYGVTNLKIDLVTLGGSLAVIAAGLYVRTILA